MTGDASLPPNAPMINGDHGEADASSSTPTHTLVEVCADLHARVSAFLSANPRSDRTRRTQEQTRISLGVIEKALQDYGFNKLSLSYNGGKDCLVLLILYLSVLHTHSAGRKASSPNSPPPSTSFPTAIPSIYAKPPDPFPSVTSFVESSSVAYHLNLTHISTSKPVHHKHSPTSNIQKEKPEQTFTFPEAFAHYLHLNPTVQAIFVGTRRTDPHGAKLTHFDLTDHNWPNFMRIHPVIDWRLSEIWCFLRAEELGQVEYCSMYEEGYTSLGGVGDTLRNPKLRHVDEGGNETYRPAYELTEDNEERLGRE